MSEITGPDRLFIALLEEWDERHPGGEALNPELQELILRHMSWARTMAAEAVINRLTRTIELTPHPGNMIPLKGLLELIRTIDPSDTNLLITPVKRDYRLKDDHLKPPEEGCKTQDARCRTKEQYERT